MGWSYAERSAKTSPDRTASNKHVTTAAQRVSSEKLFRGLSISLFYRPCAQLSAALARRRRRFSAVPEILKTKLLGACSRVPVCMHGQRAHEPHERRSNTERDAPTKPTQLETQREEGELHRSNYHRNTNCILHSHCRLELFGVKETI